MSGHFAEMCLAESVAFVLLNSILLQFPVQLQPIADSPEDAELARFTPSFLWLLRDFYLTLEEDGRKVSFLLCGPDQPL